MPQQNWREEVCKRINIPDDSTLEYLTQDNVKAFIETLLERVVKDIQDCGITIQGLATHNGKLYIVVDNLPSQRANLLDGDKLDKVKAKYLTQLRSEFGIKEGRDG